MSVQIHGNTYVTVAERLTEARKDIKSINTEVIPNGGAVIVKATVVTDKGTFTGISAANPSKAIEKASPYEVAETSAVGRALGFAGYGAVDSIASADEMKKATESEDPEWITEDEPADPVDHMCSLHGKEMKDRGQGKWDHRLHGVKTENGDVKYHPKDGNWYWCQGHGWRLSAIQ